MAIEILDSIRIGVYERSSGHDYRNYLVIQSKERNKENRTRVRYTDILSFQLKYAIPTIAIAVLGLCGIAGKLVGLY